MDEEVFCSAPCLSDAALPEYDNWLPDTWDAYLYELVGSERTHWARLPATFRWHEFHERLAQAIEARRAETGTGSVHESAVGNADASNSGRDDSHAG